MTITKDAESPLGITDTDILAVYPNPSSGVFQLSRTADEVQVYDMGGRIMYRSKSINQLDLTNNAVGQYLVEVCIGKKQRRYTVMRE